MILSPLVEGDRFCPILPGMDTALAYLRAWDPATPDGRHPIDGDRIYALVSSYASHPSTERRFEAHRRNADVQWIATGLERILHAPTPDLTVVEEYDPVEDLVFFADPPASSSFLFRPGDIAVFLPGDAHKPGCMAGASHQVRKVVVKIRL
jgi:biofilm protein TabA